MKGLFLFGASGHGKVVSDIARSNDIVINAFVDDAPKSKYLSGTPVLLSNEVNDYSDKVFVISIGDNRIRKSISEKIECSFLTVVHKSAIVSSSVKIGDGTVVMNSSNINSDSKIGKHVIINTAAVVEHDCILEDYVHISPNATVAGNVSIAEGTQIGAGAVIIPNINIGKWVTIGAGAVVIGDIPDYAVVVGNPGKIIKYNKKL